MESPDIQAKYQKLAAEYSKLRAQNQVLRKAVVDEQSKNVTLTDLLKAKDQAARKFEQEIDSLNFRNQQLSKRLTVLQDDLDQFEGKGSKKGKIRQDNNASIPDQQNNVFTEELKAKIKENETLHARLADETANHRAAVCDLEGTIEELRQESKTIKHQLEKLKRSSKEEVDQLVKERAHQEVVGQQRETQIRCMEEELTSLRQVTQATTRVDRTTSTSHLSDHSHKSPLSSSSTIAIGGDVEKVSTNVLINSFNVPIRQLCDGMSLFLSSYLENDNKDHSTDLLSDKLIEDLRSCIESWRGLSTSYQDLSKSVTDKPDSSITLETLPGLRKVKDAVALCIVNLKKLLPGIIREKQLKETNDGWSNALSRLVCCWDTLGPYLTSLACQSNPSKSLHPSAQGRVLTLFSERLVQLHTAFVELGAAWSNHVLSKKELSGGVDSHSSSNNSIAQTLVALTDAAHQICTKFRDEVLPSWSKGASSPQSTSSSSSPHLRLSSRLTSPVIDEGVYLTSGSNVDSVTLAKQLSIAATKLSQQEAEKEHWKLEYQLMQHKQQKESQRLRDVLEELKRLKKQNGGDIASDTGSISSGSSAIEPLDGEHSHSSSIIGEVSGCSGKVLEREDEIRQHMTTRCSKLYLQLTSTSSQTALFQNECEALMRRLVSCDEQRSIAEQELEEQRNTIGQVRETLQITSKNYEEQISTMSVHLADLNEKIVAQAEQIEHFKFELKNKKTKK